MPAMKPKRNEAYASRESASCLAVLLASACLLAALPTYSQSDYHSYMRISINGHPVTNIVLDKAHRGWMGLEGIEGWRRNAPGRSAATAASGAPRSKPGNSRKWTSLPLLLKPGLIGSGELRFEAGDDGEGLGPLIQAQKHKVRIPVAELDLYSDETNKIVGRYQVRQIRILSLEDASWSACPAFEVTLSFESIAREKQGHFAR
jgi:hypothetical protein